MNHVSYRLPMLTLHIIQVQYFWFVLGSLLLHLFLIFSTYPTLSCVLLFLLNEAIRTVNNTIILWIKKLYSHLFSKKELVFIFVSDFVVNTFCGSFSAHSLSNIYAQLGVCFSWANNAYRTLINKSNKEWWNCVSETKNVFISAEVSLPLSRTTRVSTITYFLHAIFRFLCSFHFDDRYIDSSRPFVRSAFNVHSKIDHVRFASPLNAFTSLGM